LIQEDIVPKEKKRRPDQADVEHGSHDRHEGIGSPERSLEGDKAVSDQPVERFLFFFCLRRQWGVTPFFLSGQSEKLDSLKDESQRKNEKSNPCQRSLNEIDHDPLLFTSK
jgi:hypothetical protein